MSLNGWGTARASAVVVGAWDGAAAPDEAVVLSEPPVAPAARATVGVDPAVTATAVARATAFWRARTLAERRTWGARRASWARAAS